MTEHININEYTTPLLWSLLKMRGRPCTASDGNTYSSGSDSWQHSISYFEDAVKANKNLYSFQDENELDDIYFFFASSEEELVKKWTALPNKSFTPLADGEEDEDG